MKARWLALLTACVLISGATENLAGAGVSRRFVPATTPVTELPAGSIEVPPGSTGPPNGGAALPQSQAVPPGASVAVLARSSSGASTPGAAAPFFVLVTNSGGEATTPGQPVVLTIGVPRGLAFAGVTDLDEVSGLLGFPTESRSPPGTTWRCAAAGSTVRCEFARRVGGRLLAEPLPSKTSSALFVRFDVASGLRVPQRGSVLTAGFHIAAPGNTNARDTSVDADVTIANDLPRPQLFVDLGGTASVQAGTRSTERVEVMNVGSGAATSMSLSDLLPAAVLGTWRSSSSTWTCTGTVPSCSYSGTVGVGKLAPPLTLTYTLDQARYDALQLPIGGKSHLEDWTITANARGASPASAATFGEQLEVEAPPGSLLMPEVVAAHGIDELLPGSSTTLEVTLTNLGKAATAGEVVLKGTMPAGVELAGATERGVGGTSGRWPCTTQPLDATLQELRCTSSAVIPAARSVELTLPLEAAPTAKPGDGAVILDASAANQPASAEAKSATVPLIVLPGNAGFPALTLSHATGAAANALQLQPAVDGAPAELLTGGYFAEQFGVRDAGGAPIAAGAEGELEQTLGAGVEVQSIRTPPGWTCGTSGGPAPVLRCTFPIAQDLQPAQSLSGPTITLVPTRPTPAATSWPASVRLVSGGVPNVTHLPVLVSVSEALASLQPDITTELVPTAGGIGRFDVAVTNTGTGTTRSDVRLSLRLPHGARLETIGSPGWSCTPAATTAVCTAPPLSPGGELAPVALTATFARGTAQRSLTVVAHAADGAARVPKSAVAAATVEPRPALRAVIKAPENVVFADEPRTTANAPLSASTVTLEGDGSGGSGAGLTYAWTQSEGPPVRWLRAQSLADVSFSVPAVTKLTTLAFKLSVSDGSATATAVTRVRVVPETPASAGFSFAHPHPPTTVPAAGPRTAERRLPLPAEHLQATTTATTKAHEAAPLAPAADTVATTTTAGTTTTTTTTTASTAVTGPLCDFVRDAAKGKSFSQSFGSISFSLSDVQLSGTGCTTATTLSFSSSSLKFGSYLDATGLAGSISKNGISLTAGTFTGPAAWHSPVFTIGDKGLSLPFSGSDVEIDGTVTGSGLAFVPLPSGWDGTTSLTFTAGSGSTSVSVDTEGTGPARDASPDSPKPTVSIQGSVANDGTFSLDVTLARLVDLQGHSLDVTGHVARATADGPLEVKLTGKLNEGFDIVPGLRVEALSVELAPTTESLGLSGEGTILVQSGSTSLGVDVKLTYDDPKNWSLTADGAGTSSWTPLPGLTISPSDVHGSITAKDDKYELSLKVSPKGTWSPTSAVSISDVELLLASTCEDTGAPCPRDASLFLQTSGRADFQLPSVGKISTELRGVLALPSGDLSLAAKLTNPIDVGAGITIDAGKIVLTRGVSVAAGTALLAGSNEAGGLQLAINGSATLPVVGKIPVVEAAFSGSGWSIAAQLGSFSLPGSSGDGSKLGDTIVGWSSFKTSLKVVDPVTKAVSKLELPANTFELSGSFTTPSWLKSMLKLPGDVSGRANGSVNLSTGEFGLRMEFTLPSATYLMGSSTSASSVQLASAYFEILRKSGDFSIALGGTADLKIAKTSSAPESSVGLGIALSFSASTQTVAGEFTLKSEAGWQQAFGVKDLTLKDLAVAFQINLTTLTPGIGFGARAILPGAIRDPLGIPNTAETTLVANISVTNPCIGIELDNPANPAANVLDIAKKGVLTARQFEVEVAPTGCKVGQFSYQPGLSIEFDGAIAGVAVQVEAHLGLSPFAVDAKLAIGEFAVGGLNVQKTDIALAISSSKFSIKFAGGVTVLGASVELSGGLAQNGTTTKIDFTGKLDNLALGAVAIKQVEVEAHIQIGSTSSLSFKAKGSIELLGSSAEADFELGIDNGKLLKAKASVKAKIVVGGSGGITLDGTFKLDYEPGKNFAVDATVRASVGGYTFGSATVAVRSSSLTLDAELKFGDVFTAKLAGAVYYGSVPSGTKIAGPNGTKVDAKAGDFLISAKDVSINLGGFKANGTIELGRANGGVWGNLATTIQLLGSSSGNSVSIAGSFSSDGDFSFSGSGNLNLVGVTASVNVKVAKVRKTVTVHGDSTVSVLGSSVAFSGDFQYDGGTPRVRLKGEANLVLAGYSLASAKFAFSNFPSDAGLFAEVKIDAGSVFKASGRLTIVGSRFYLGVNANLDLRVINVTAEAVFTNCTDASCKAGKSTTTLDAKSAMSFGGFSFGIEVHISSNGSFSATARSPASGRFYGSSPHIYLLVVAFYADFSYDMALTISSNSPYVALKGYGSGDLYGKTWGYRGWFWWGWTNWAHIFGITASINTNPFEVCGYVRVWGSEFGGCFRT